MVGPCSLIKNQTPGIIIQAALEQSPDAIEFVKI